LSRSPLPHVKTDTTDLDFGSTQINMVQLESLPISWETIRKVGDSDPVYMEVRKCVKNGWPTTVVDELKPYHNRRDELCLEQDCLLWGRRVVIPQQCVGVVLKELHANHDGITRTKAFARLHVWWPTIDKDMENVVANCSKCHMSRNAAPVSPGKWPEAAAPWERIHMDFLFLEGKSIFVMIDTFSKWIEAKVMGSTSAAKVIEELRGIFAVHGIPRVVVSDNGPPFRSKELGDFFERNGVQQKFSASYHPATNGAAERSVQIVKNGLKKLSGPLEVRLERFLFRYRATPQSVTGVSPAMKLMGRELRTRLNALIPQGEEVQELIPAKRSLDENDRVLVQNVGDTQKWSYGTVVKKLGSHHYLVDIGTRWIKKHIDQLLFLSARVDDSMTAEGPQGAPVRRSECERLPLLLPVNQPNGANDALRRSTRTGVPRRRFPIEE